MSSIEYDCLPIFESACSVLGASTYTLLVRRDDDRRMFDDKSLRRAFALAIVNDAPREVLLVALTDGVAVAPLRRVWSGTVPPPEPRLTRPVGVVAWSEFEMRPTVANERLQGFVKHAGTRRQRTYRTCCECGDRTPPEYLFDRSPPLCMGCAERIHGIVF